MERFYKIADFIFRVSGPDEWMYKQDGILMPFAFEGNSYHHHLEFEVVEDLDKPVGKPVYSDPSKLVFQEQDTHFRYVGAVQQGFENAYMRIMRHGNQSQIQVKRSSLGVGITAKTVLNAMEAEHFIVMSNGILLHASYINRNGKAILFTAPSGTGKSTQADLWCRLRGAELINGDRAAVQHDNGIFKACGVPFSGSSGVGKNVTLPVAAIVYLSQAPCTTITKLVGVRAFRHIWEGCTVNSWSNEDVNVCTRTVAEIVKNVPIFLLACTPDVTAVEALEQALGNWRK